MKKILLVLLLIASLNLALTANSSQGTLEMENSTISCGQGLPCYAYFTFTPNQNISIPQVENVNWATNNFLTINLEDVYSGVKFYSPRVKVELKQLISRDFYETTNCRNESRDIRGQLTQVLTCNSTKVSRLVQDYEAYTLFDQSKALVKNNVYEFRLTVQKPASNEYKYTVCMLGACVDPLFGSEIEWVNFATNFTSVQGTNNIYYLYWNGTPGTVGSLTNLSAVQWNGPAPSNTFIRLTSNATRTIQWEEAALGAGNRNFQPILAWKYNGTVANNFTVLGNFTCNLNCNGDFVNLSFYTNSTLGVITSLVNISIPQNIDVVVNVTYTNLQPNQTIVMVVDPLADDTEAGDFRDFRIVGRSIANRFIDIPSPANTTYALQPILLNFSVLNDPGQDFTCWSILDGTLTLFGNVTSGLYNSTNLSTVSVGSHNLTMVCSDGAFNVTRERFFNFQEIGFDNIFPNPGYELNISDYNLQVLYSSNVSDVNATLFLNGTLQNITKTTNASFFDFSTSTVIPIIFNNGTYQTVSWNVSILFANGTLQTRNFTGNQSLYQSYAIRSLVVDLPVTTEGSTVIFTATLLRLTPNGGLLPVLTLNGSNYSSTIVNFSFLQTNVSIPNINTTTAQLFFTQHLSITFNNQTRTIAFPGVNNNTNAVNVTDLTLTTCYGAVPGGYGIAFNFTSVDEETQARVQSDWQAAFDLFSTNNTYINTINLTAYNTSFFPVCISPGGVQIKISSIQSYEGSPNNTGADKYPKRFYFLTNATINTSQHQNVTVFLFNSSTTINGFEIGKQFKVLVSDESDSPIQQAVVIFERLFIGNSSSLPVAMTKTSNNGEGAAYLRSNDVFYKIKVVQNGQILIVTEPRQLYCAPASTDCVVTIVISSQSKQNYWKYYGLIAHSCNYQNATGILTCSYTDTSGLAQRVNLTVYNYGLFSAGIDCTNTTITSSATLFCQVSNTSRTYYWQLVLTTATDQTILEDGIINNIINNDYGTVGLLSALVIILTVAAVGAYVSVVASLILAALGILMSFWFNFLPIGAASVAAIILVALILAYKAKE